MEVYYTLVTNHDVDCGMFSETTHERQEDAWAGEILGILWSFSDKASHFGTYTVSSFPVI